MITDTLYIGLTNTKDKIEIALKQTNRSMITLKSLTRIKLFSYLLSVLMTIVWIGIAINSSYWFLIYLVLPIVLMYVNTFVTIPAILTEQHILRVLENDINKFKKELY